MKKLRLILVLWGIPVVFHAQRSLTGLWTGTITNDSITIRKEQSFEIALTQYKQKVYGYTRSSFIVNDTLYYILKRVKGAIEGDSCEVKDDEIVSYNFPGKLDKGVKVTTVFRMNQQDSSWYLSGDWSTNKVRKKYYSISGKIDLKEETDYDKSKIFPHLEELDLAKDVEFYAAAKQPVETKSTVVNKRPQTSLNKTQENTALQQKKGKPEIISDNPVPEKPTQPVAIKVNDKKANTKTNSTVLKQEEKKPEITIAAPAALVTERKTVAPQVVSFKSDSLQLALYDNGEIDGDTVSVLLNGEIILAKQLLKASAIKKTIYIRPEQDEVTLVLYAENLGKYPPNTGLLVVHDGEDVYQVRFSADLQQNASVTLRRKK